MATDHVVYRPQLTMLTIQSERAACHSASFDRQKHADFVSPKLSVDQAHLFQSPMCFE